MSPPVFQDNKSIRDEERLFRRVHIRQLVKDDDTGLARVSSGVFRDKDLSVNIESVLIDLAGSFESCLHDSNAHKLISITAQNARQVGQAVCRDPLPTDLSHGLVYGSKNARSVHDGLRALAEWVIPTGAPPFEEIELERRMLGI
jgi:hypothetical protein